MTVRSVSVEGYERRNDLDPMEGKTSDDAAASLALVATSEQQECGGERLCTRTSNKSITSERAHTHRTYPSYSP